MAAALASVHGDAAIPNAVRAILRRSGKLSVSRKAIQEAVLGVLVTQMVTA